MNSIWIILVVFIWLVLGYRFYGKFIEKRLKINDHDKTPANFKKEGVDFSPAKKPFLVGHHFAAIAGAGPIIGPILAVSYFGWLPVVLWVSLGSVFMGAMHDYTTLITSVRNKGKGISTIAKNYFDTKAGWIFGFMIWLTLLLIVTVFSVSSAESFLQIPELVIPIASISFIAIILGFLVKKYNINYKLSSLIGLIFVFFFVYVGYKFPVDLLSSGLSENLVRTIWISLIMIYAGIVSILPVGFLMRPRDYLSSLQMISIMFLGLISLIIVRPAVNAPAFIQNSIFPLWPILFITVACGAISGFHGLVSSGTTSKQLAKESHGRPVAYGSMLMEAALAVLVTIFVISGLQWGNNLGSFQELLSKGWILVFSNSFANVVSANLLFKISFPIAIILGGLMINQFILTSVDSSTRLSRLIISENLYPKLKNKFILVLLILIPAWLLAVTNTYEELWRLFGTSNQLIASISLIVVSCYFLSTKKKVKFILIPAIFVLLTTLSSLIYLTFKTGGFLQTQNYFLMIIAFVMFLLGLIVAFEGIKNLRKLHLN